jgi:predicted RNase H-like HicB family nuclease
MPDQTSRGGHRYSQLMTIKTRREKDGRWIAETLGLPGVMVYGDTETEARTKALDLAVQVLSSPSSTSQRGFRARKQASARAIFSLESLWKKFHIRGT